MRVDHSSILDIRTNIDIHRRHAGNAASYVSPVAHAGTAGNNADTLFQSNLLQRISGLVKELGRATVRHGNNTTHSKTQKDALFHPAVNTPTSRLGIVRF